MKTMIATIVLLAAGAWGGNIVLDFPKVDFGPDAEVLPITSVISNHYRWPDTTNMWAGATNYCEPNYLSNQTVTVTVSTNVTTTDNGRYEYPQFYLGAPNATIIDCGNNDTLWRGWTNITPQGNYIEPTERTSSR